MSDAIAWHTTIARSFADRYRHSPAFREREAVWRDLIARYTKPGGHALDAGCGSGVMAALAADRGAHVLAFDASPAMLNLAAESLHGQTAGKVELQLAEMGDPTLLQERSFDLILCSSVMEYLDDWWAAFDWLAASLAPSGTILLSMPNGQSLYRRTERTMFRLTGRPAYYRHVRAVPRLVDIEHGLRQRGFCLNEHRFYARAPVLSPILRALGLERYSDTLFVVAARRI
ncbi:class I SAM-dependent methyltransferase [Tianweitania sp. BSSL-BM11]|uniref:Class I SAM-dependent methyltransferase n=1 Tax=Tianweitania aestuarii TaxID=2814886 RepID=A0ABS5RUS3_9HYPH|nr:class I SAM-dependent methyltransferase [Tianweitania aestuarii]MBS9719457.1 class I SAM-dependent methyltransferase [Tianweitania aestuarii]